MSSPATSRYSLAGRGLLFLAILSTYLFTSIYLPATLARGAINSQLPLIASEHSDLPPLIDQPVPPNITPTIANAPLDRATPYKDRCHTQQNLTASIAPCLYGDLSSKTTIVLFGDSHALAWFPAIERLATIKHWKLLSLTMSSCWPANMPAWNGTTNVLMTNCPVWRSATLKRIIATKPAMIFIAGTRGFQTTNSKGDVATGDERTAIWQQGMQTTLASLKQASKKVVYLADVPQAFMDIPDCLDAFPESISQCATPSSIAFNTGWTDAERQVAVDSGIIFVDPTRWICTTEPCSPISGNMIIYIDAGHMTATFARSLEPKLWSTISGANPGN